MPASLFGMPWRIAIQLGLAIALIAGFLFYGHMKYRDGVDDTDARWEEAGRKLEAKAKASAGRADAASVQRQATYQDQLEKQKERMDEASADGSSPFDVLFGG